MTILVTHSRLYNLSQFCNLSKSLSFLKHAVLTLWKFNSTTSAFPYTTHIL